MNSSHLSSKIILCIFLVIFPLTTISGFNIVTPFRLEKLKNKNLKLHLISKATLMHKAKDKYTGWVELGISLRYDINSSKIIRNRGLIKRRQTIIE